jgi:predicted NBD/HSP70 family sugar kinase
MTAPEARRSTSTVEAAPPTIGSAPALAGGAAMASAAAAAASLFRHGLRPTAKVLPEHARSHNRSLVLQTLYANGPQSRADIARETGLTRVTVSDLVAELIAERLVVELGTRDDVRPGKPATLLDIDRHAFHIVGLDLSDRSVLRGAVLALDGTVLSRVEVALDEAAGDAVLEKVHALIAELLASTTTPVLGIGIGSPGIVDDAGVVRSAPNLGWIDVALREAVERRVGLPVHVANDANVAVLAEHGSQDDDRDLMLITVGHGVGAGILVGGRLILGSGFTAGEIGHVVVGTDGGPPCACGKSGCLEAWLAEPRLSAELDALGDGEADAAARERVLREAGRRLAIVLAPVVAALGLDEVVLSGPHELLDGPLMAAAVETLRSRTMAELTRDLQFRMTAHGQDIVLRGAAVMVLSGQLGVS